jgi:hypothetical protein
MSTIFVIRNPEMTKKNVNADEASPEAKHFKRKEHDCEHRHCPQARNVGSKDVFFRSVGHFA